MFRFENKYILYALLLVPIMTGVYTCIRYRYKKKMKDYGESSLLKLLMPDSSPLLQHIKFALLCLIYILFVIALANPQKGAGKVTEKRKGISIMFCIDVSNSMLAQDYSPNRIEAAKRGLSSFVDNLQGDKIGIVIFAGKAFVQLPITSDYAAAKMFVSNISTKQINTQGTDIAAAIDMAAASMLPAAENTGNKLSQDNTNKVIVVISDGEDHYEEAVDMARQVYDNYKIRVYTVGVGSSQGEPIPVYHNGQLEYKKDREGTTVITRLNEQILRDIAQAGKGAYIYANNSFMGFSELYDELNKLEKQELESVTYARYQSKYYIPLWIAFVLLVAEIFLYNRKMLKFKLIDRIKKENLLRTVIFIIAGSSVLTLSAQNTSELRSLREGNKQYKQAEKLQKDASDLQAQNRKSNQAIIADKQNKAQNLYRQANTNYIKANASTGNYYKSMYNQAAALYKQGKYDDAAKKLEPVINNANVSDKVKASAYYNLGNNLLKSEKYQESINAYKKALKLNPKDMNAKYNLEYARKKLLMQQNQQQQNQDKQDNKDQNKDNKDGNNQNQQQQQNQDRQQQGQDKQQQNKDNRQQQNNGESQADRQKREMAKRQLDALQQNEKNTQEKVKLMEQKSGRPVKQEKDW
ncbi:MAG: VWA domain-containing protein [Bacteroidales bacterium]|nr:VWA domain-containing protein [Bacteroidales bacterium]